jgi:aerobic-type carbon monoxide dehydrogenase small subunit (CoxS/CutS family)
MADDDQEIAVTINGTLHRAHVPADLSLLDWLQEDLGLTGTKFCCGIGVCRACTVAVQSGGGQPGAESPLVPVVACSTPAAALDGQSVMTVEGLGSPERLSALQEAFLRHFAFQCGYCTPGFLMAAHILLDRLRKAPVGRGQIDAAIAEACGAHICRCTGYVRYHAAIRAVVLAELGLAP